MNWDIAKKAFDFFVNWIITNQRFQVSPYSFSIGFYSGEPLLNFDLIARMVDYSKNCIHQNQKEYPFGFHYSVTTNGLLLNEEIILFLVKNNFRVLISLDDPKSIHEKNKGKDTFDKLEKIIRNIKNKYPEYYSSNISFSIVYAKDTDLLQILEYFSNDLFESSFKMALGEVITYFSYLHFPSIGINEELVYSKIMASVKYGHSLNKIEKAILSEYYRISINTLSDRHGANYASFCTLGAEKLQFSVNGDIHSCERVGKSFAIGDVYTGIDINKIYKIKKEGFEKTSECGDCIAQSQCNACVGTSGYNGEIFLENICRQLRTNINKRFPEYIEYKIMEGRCLENMVE